MGNKAPQINEKTANEARNGAISFSGKLDSGELLTGTPTVVDCSPPSPETLVFTSIAVNTAILTINGESVPIGEAVQFKVTGGVAGIKYTIKATCGTDSTPAQTLIGSVTMRVTPDC